MRNIALRRSEPASGPGGHLAGRGGGDARDLFTVWVNLFERGFAADGDRVLVHGGTSGIGTMAIELGKLFGLR